MDSLVCLCVFFSFSLLDFHSIFAWTAMHVCPKMNRYCIHHTERALAICTKSKWITKIVALINPFKCECCSWPQAVCRQLRSVRVSTERVCIRRSQFEQNVADRSVLRSLCMNHRVYLWQACSVLQAICDIFMQKFRADGRPSTVSSTIFGWGRLVGFSVSRSRTAYNINYVACEIQTTEKYTTVW